jgi:hypothetical protein
MPSTPNDAAKFGGVGRSQTPHQKRPNSRRLAPVRMPRRLARRVQTAHVTIVMRVCYLRDDNEIDAERCRISLREKSPITLLTLDGAGKVCLLHWSRSIDPVRSESSRRNEVASGNGTGDGCVDCPLTLRRSPRQQPPHLRRLPAVTREGEIPRSLSGLAMPRRLVTLAASSSATIVGRLLAGLGGLRSQSGPRGQAIIASTCQPTPPLCLDPLHRGGQQSCAYFVALI